MPKLPEPIRTVINENGNVIRWEYPELDPSFWFKRIRDPEIGPYNSCVDLKPSINYERTKNIFTQFYNYYGLPQENSSRQLSYEMYKRIMDICHVVTGDFFIKGDLNKKYTISATEYGSSIGYCRKDRKAEFESLWSDILDVIEAHTQKIYEQGEAIGN